MYSATIPYHGAFNSVFVIALFSVFPVQYMIHGRMIFYMLLFLTTTLCKGLAEVVVVGGPNHSPGSTVETTFSTQKFCSNMKLSARMIIVCNILVSQGTLYSYACTPADGTYYSNNSKVSATLNSDVLKAVFTYSNAREENKPINVSVSDVVGTSFTYGTRDLIVKACSDLDNANHQVDNATSSPSYCNDNYDYYNCTVLFLCVDGYYDNNVIATCQANATWSSEIFCIPAQRESTIIGTYMTRPALSPTSDSPPTSSATPNSQIGLSIGAAIVIGVCIGLATGIIVTSVIWWWMLKRVSEKLATDEKKETAYEPTYVDPQGLEPAYDVINQETVEGDGRVASQQQTNVNAAYEVIT